MLVRGANEKKNDRELCVTTCWYKEMLRRGNSLEVYNLWNAYVPMIR